MHQDGRRTLRNKRKGTEIREETIWVEGKVRMKQTDILGLQLLHL